MRIDRLISIIVMLLNKDKISARELSGKFEVSVRTIYRDIDTINLAGIPVVSFPGNNGGFGILENYKIDRQVLTLKDMLAILSALKGINKTLDSRELEVAIEKINNLVPKEKSSDLNLYSEQLIFDIIPWGLHEDLKEKIKIIQRSIINKKIIEFDYINNKAESSSRIIEPMTLVFKGFSWYLFSFCRMKNDYRFFNISKMKNLNTKEDFFSRRNKKYTDFLDTLINNKDYANIVLKFSPNVKNLIYEYYESENIKELDDGHLLVKVSYPIDEWVYANLLSYGENLEVIEPVYIREMIIKKAENILKNYQT